MPETQMINTNGIIEKFHIRIKMSFYFPYKKWILDLFGKALIEFFGFEILVFFCFKNDLTYNHNTKKSSYNEYLYCFYILK